MTARRYRTRAIGPWARDILNAFGFIAAAVLIFWKLPVFAEGFWALVETIRGSL